MSLKLANSYLSLNPYDYTQPQNQLEKPTPSPTGQLGTLACQFAFAYAGK